MINIFVAGIIYFGRVDGVFKIYYKLARKTFLKKLRHARSYFVTVFAISVVLGNHPIFHLGHFGPVYFFAGEKLSILFLRLSLKLTFKLALIAFLHLLSVLF